MLQVDLDEILRRITDTKNIAGVVVVNSDGVTVKSTLDNSLTALVREGGREGRLFTPSDF